MNLSCDHCPHTASGLEIDLLDEGWAWIRISTPFRKTFTACPHHGTEMAQAALDAIEVAGAADT